MSKDSEIQKLDKMTLLFVYHDLMKRADKLMSLVTDAATLQALELSSDKDRATIIIRAETCQSLGKRYGEIASALPDSVPVKRPRDFMSQAVSWVLGDRKTLNAQQVLTRILCDETCKRQLVRVPTIDNVRETLSTGSRDPQNPRFIREARGYYKRNPKYKAPKNL